MEILHFINSIIIIASIITYIIDFAQIVEHIKRWMFYRVYTKDTPYRYYTLKPFDCSGCLSFWVSLIYFSYIYGVCLGIPLAFITGVVTLIIRKIII